MANQRAWSFTQNPFLNATINSLRIAVRISNTHLAALTKFAGDPFFDALIAFYAPLDAALNTAVTAIKEAGGEQQGSTVNLNQLYNLLSSSRIRQWDITIQGVYELGTPQYKALLPHRRTPFQVGTQTERLIAVQTLSMAIGSDAQLAAVKTGVDNFYKQLSDALSGQKGDVQGGGILSKQAEAARVAMCIGQYADLGALMQNYAATPDMITSFFDMIIRSGAQVLFTGDDKPQEHKNILKHTFAAADMLSLENDGVTDQQFYLANSKTAAPDKAVVTVTAGQKLSIAASQLGDVTNTFLNVYNPDELIKASGRWSLNKGFC